MKLFTQIILLLVSSFLYAQKFGTEKLNKLYLPYSTEFMTEVVLEKVKGRDGYFNKNLSYCSYNIQFNSDSTYVFYFVSAKDYKLSAGTYAIFDDVYMLYWDSILTQKIIESSDEYKKYFKFKPPALLETRNIAYYIEGNELVPYNLNFKTNRIELLPKSSDLWKSHPQLDEFKSIYYNSDGGKLKINYEVNKKLEFNKDSIWGYVETKKRKLILYRLMPKGFNWHGLPGIQVVQIDYFILYIVGDSRTYSYFSKDFDSEIFPLTIKNIEKQFKEKPCFIESVKREFGTSQALSSLDHNINSYRIVELYKSCYQ